MSSAPKVYGWCPGALRPMMSGDGLVVRIRAPLGRLSRSQTLGLAALAERFGNGRLDLSARANLQLRGVSEADHAALIDGLRDLALVDADASAESRCNLLLTPHWHQGDETYEIATELAETLRRAEDLRMPGKFGFAIDAGPAPLLQNIAADIRIERSGDGGLLLVADGLSYGQPVSASRASEDAIALARWFLAEGGAPEGRGRMRALTARRAPAFAPETPRAAPAPLPVIGPTSRGCLVGLEFGQIPASTLAALGELGALRLTPWRALLLEGQSTFPPLPGLILDAADPRLQITACTGAPGCLQALAPTRDLARRLAALLPRNTALHVSGCEKGCAHPQATDLTLVARGPDLFDLIKGGTASDHPTHSALSAAALQAAPHLLTKGS